MLESVLGLGDLADLTVTNDETDYSYDVRHKQNHVLLVVFRRQTFIEFNHIVYYVFVSAAVQ